VGAKRHPVARKAGGAACVDRCTKTMMLQISFFAIVFSKIFTFVAVGHSRGLSARSRSMPRRICFCLKKTSIEASISITSSIARSQSPCLQADIERDNSRKHPQQHAHGCNSSEVGIVTCVQRKENDSS
jgi:hypothetical protein